MKNTGEPPVPPLEELFRAFFIWICFGFRASDFGFPLPLPAFPVPFLTSPRLLARSGIPLPRTHRVALASPALVGPAFDAIALGGALNHRAVQLGFMSMDAARHRIMFPIDARRRAEPPIPRPVAPAIDAPGVVAAPIAVAVVISAVPVSHEDDPAAPVDAVYEPGPRRVRGFAEVQRAITHVLHNRIILRHVNHFRVCRLDGDDSSILH